TELVGDPEVECDRLRVTDVKVSIRLGREAGHDLGNPALRTSAATISRMKSLRRGVSGPSALAALLIVSKRLVRTPEQRHAAREGEREETESGAFNQALEEVGTCSSLTSGGS